MKRSLSTLALAVVLGACAVSDQVAPTTEQAPVGELSLNRQFFNRNVDVCLTLLHNNDGESQLIDAGEGLEDFGGIARFATVVRDLRRQSERGLGATSRAKRCGVSVLRSATLLVSSGDNYLAGPEFNASIANGTFYDAIALDRIKYDAIVLGNHEFDFGPENLAAFIAAFDRRDEQFVSANLDFSGEPALQALVNRRRIAKSTIVVDGGERFGIVGATTPALPTVSSPGNVLVSAMVAQEVQAEIDRLLRRGIDKIIFISHLQSIEEDKLLIPQLHGVDIAVAGGGDDLLANPGDLLVPGDVADPSKPYPLIVQDAAGRDVPLVTTSGAYRYVGRLVVGFDRRGEILMVEDGSGPVRVAGGSQPDAVQPDASIQAQVVEPVQAYVADLAATVVANTAVDLDGRRSQVRSVETNQGNLVADGIFFTAQQRAAQFGAPQPNVALVNGGGIRNDAIIAAGSPLTALSTFSISPFGNFVSIVPGIPRAQFLALLENAVSRVEFGDGRFLQVSGFSFSWSPSAPAGSRVVDVVLDGGVPVVLGGVVQAGPALNIATLDFLARGGDSSPYAGAPFTTLGITDQQALQNYLTDGLGGVVSAADYPVGGEGRIVRVP